MKKKRRFKGGEIPTSSMADIAFLLLIFFLVTTTIDTDKGLGIVLPKGEKKNNMRVLSALLEKPSRGVMQTAPKRLKGYQDREAPKDFSAKKFINELQSTLRETKGNILDYKLATQEKILSLSPRQYKEVIMEITPKLNRGGLMTR